VTLLVLASIALALGALRPRQALVSGALVGLVVPAVIGPHGRHLHGRLVRRKQISACWLATVHIAHRRGVCCF